jgi:adenylate cyclase
MAEGQVQRRLAAILAADVVGYSRLIRADEEGTLAALKLLRADVIDPRIAGHNGRVVKLMGDGMLAEFASVVDAVRAAVETQRAVAQRNAALPTEKHIEFRVGINLGDVVIDGDDIHGDGVNVASRLEGLADPGGICISGGVHDQVRDRIEQAFEDLGEQEVKNIDRPIRVWRWKGESGKGARALAEPLPLPDKPSIAVLPFDNMSGDPEQEYFSDGLAEDIITALSKVAQMRVIARNSTFAYKGQALDLRRIAGELGVRYFLEGSVRRGGDRLRITAQLIDAADGSHIWAERFDRTVDDLFDIQDEITKEIVTSLRVKLTDGEQARVWARGTNNIEAWEYCVRATELFKGFTSLGFTYWWDGRLGYTGDSEAKFARAAELAERAMALDDSVSECIGLSTMVAAPLGRHDEGVEIARRGVDLYPGSADVRAFLAFALLHAGNYSEAVEHFRAAMALNPFYPNWYRNGLARTLIFLDEFDEALALSDEILRLEPAFLQAWLQRAYIFGEIGREADADHAIREVRRLAPNLRLGDVPGLLLINDTVATRRFVDSLRKAGLPE